MDAKHKEENDKKPANGNSAGGHGDKESKDNKNNNGNSASGCQASDATNIGLGGKPTDTDVKDDVTRTVFLHPVTKRPVEVLVGKKGGPSVSHDVEGMDDEEVGEIMEMMIATANRFARTSAEQLNKEAEESMDEIDGMSLALKNLAAGKGNDEMGKKEEEDGDDEKDEDA